MSLFDIDDPGIDLAALEERVRAAIEETRRRQSRLASNVTEKINSLATVQAFGQMAHEQRLMRRQSERSSLARSR